MVILFKVIYSLHFSITPCTYYGLGFSKYEIMKALDLEITGAWKNVGTMHWLLGEYGTGITLFHLLYLLDHVLHKLIILWSCHWFGQGRGIRLSLDSLIIWESFPNIWGIIFSIKTKYGSIRKSLMYCISWYRPENWKFRVIMEYITLTMVYPRFL